jgi:hypothetical protein
MRTDDNKKYNCSARQIRMTRKKGMQYVSPPAPYNLENECGILYTTTSTSSSSSASSSTSTSIALLSLTQAASYIIISHHCSYRVIEVVSALV